MKDIWGQKSAGSNGNLDLGQPQLIQERSENDQVSNAMQGPPKQIRAFLLIMKIGYPVAHRQKKTVSQAIEDSGIEVQGSERVGIIFGSGYGLLRTTFNFLDSIIEDGDECASPIKFATSVHNSLASNVSITLGIKGASLTISTFHHSTAGIFQTAMNWLDSKMVDHVLVGMGDEYCDAMGYVLKRAECQHEENTYIPGELFTCILLGRESEQQSGYGKIKEVHLSKKIDQVEPELFNKLDAVIIAENGESCVANLYETVIPFGKTIITYSSLYGCSTVGNGIDTAVAALSLRDKKLYAPPSIPPGINPDMISAGKPLKENSMIGCLECADSRMNLIIVANQ